MESKEETTIFAAFRRVYHTGSKAYNHDVRTLRLRYDGQESSFFQIVNVLGVSYAFFEQQHVVRAYAVCAVR